MDTTSPARPPTGARTPTTPGQLTWLTGELAGWQRDGLLDGPTAAVILDRYRSVRRLSLARLLLAIGACFVGVGLIWLVAANLAQVPPWARFGGITAIWLALLLAPETAAARDRLSRAVTGTLRLAAALALGAVVFQAAQSLQVPAFEPRLVGLWGAGALLQAYAVRAVLPLLVGLVTGTAWLLMEALAEQQSGLAVVLLLGTVAVVGISLAVVHDVRLTALAVPWRETGCALGLAALFAAALPFVDAGGFAWNRWLVLGLAATALAVAAGVTLGRGRARLEPLVALAGLAVAVLLGVWDAGADADAVGAAGWAHAGVSITTYVAAAVAVAVLGTLRDSWRLTALATLALVAFTTVQAFAVFARILEGAWLFLLLGLVLAGTGFAFDRARRGLAATLEEAS